MKKKKKWIHAVVLALLCIAVCVLFTARGLKTFEKNLYPQKYSEIVEEYAAENEVDPLLIYAIIRTESGFDPQATSGVDARGLMQITDETFQWIKSKIAREEEITFADLYDEKVNIRFGTYYFARCLERYEGHVGTAAAAYHSGWGTVDKLLKNSQYSSDGKILHTYPYEQMGLYVQKIDRAYTKYQTFYSNQENEV